MNEDQVLMEFESLNTTAEGNHNATWAKVKSVIVNRKVRSTLQISIY